MPLGYKLLDRVRLEVQADPPALPNYVKNPDGELGGWFYLTPLANQLVSSETVSGVNRLVLVTADAAQQGVALTEPIPVAAGRSVGARVDFVARQYSTDRVSLQLVFTNDAGAVVGTGAASAFADLATIYAPVATAPAAARYVQLQVTQSDLTSTVEVGRNRASITNVMLTHSATTVPATFAYANPYTWVNVMGPTSDIKVDRAGLNLGTLSAVIYDTTLDPATAPTLRPGKAVRLTALDSTGAAWSPVFTGTITNGQVDYNFLAPKASKRTKITLTAVDAVSTLANVARPNVYAGSGVNLTETLEGAGVPWSLNGYKDQSYNVPPPIAVIRDASALDQVAIARDTARGFAWVNRAGVLCTSPAGTNPPSGTWFAQLDSSTYLSDSLAVDYNTADCINVVTVKLLRPNLATGETVEVAYGPYRNQASVDQWGAYSTEVTVVGLADTEAAVGAYAQALLAANATPKVRVNGLTLTIKDLSDFSAASGLTRVFLDLYNKVRVVNPVGSIDETSLITSLSHRITADNGGGRWLIDVGFSAATSTASPQATPAPAGGTISAGASAQGWQTLTGGGFPINQSSYQIANGYCTIQLALDGGGAYPNGYVFLTLPPAACPKIALYGLGQYGTAVRPFTVQTDGRVLANGASSTGCYGMLTWPLG